MAESVTPFSTSTPEPSRWDFLPELCLAFAFGVIAGVGVAVIAWGLGRG